MVDKREAVMKYRIEVRHNGGGSEWEQFGGTIEQERVEGELAVVRGWGWEARVVEVDG